MGFKLQIPSTKLQRNSNIQTSKHRNAGFGLELDA
jgi:hypothetical protein